MEDIILSMLLIKSATIYEMKLFIQQCLTSVCSDSLGSIQSAIKKLMEKNCVECHELIEGSMLKKVYSITDTGLLQFTDWIKTPMDLQKVRSMENGKFFFLGMASGEARIKSIEGYIESLELEKAKLLQISALTVGAKDSLVAANVERIKREKHIEEYLLRVSGEQDLSAVVQNIYAYQIYNLEYGLARLEYDIQFYQSILAKELTMTDK